MPFSSLEIGIRGRGCGERLKSSARLRKRAAMDLKDQVKYYFIILFGSCLGRTKREKRREKQKGGRRLGDWIVLLPFHSFRSLHTRPNIKHSRKSTGGNARFCPMLVESADNPRLPSSIRGVAFPAVCIRRRGKTTPRTSWK